MIGHSSSIYSLAFSAESSLLVSGSADWTVRCWDVKGAGGARSIKSQKNGAVAVNGNRTYPDDENADTYVTKFSFSVCCLTIHPRVDLLATFPTKRTPITNVQFTSRNLCLVGGIYLAPEAR